MREAAGSSSEMTQVAAAAARRGLVEVLETLQVENTRAKRSEQADRVLDLR